MLFWIRISTLFFFTMRDSIILCNPKGDCASNDTLFYCGQEKTNFLLKNKI